MPPRYVQWCPRSGWNSSFPHFFLIGPLGLHPCEWGLRRPVNGNSNPKAHPHSPLLPRTHSHPTGVGNVVTPVVLLEGECLFNEELPKRSSIHAHFSIKGEANLGVQWLHYTVYIFSKKGQIGKKERKRSVKPSQGATIYLRWVQPYSLKATQQGALGASMDEWGLLRWLRWWRILLQCRRPRFNPWVGKIPWRRKWVPIPVFLPGKSHGQRILAGHRIWGRKELDMT